MWVRYTDVIRIDPGAVDGNFERGVAWCAKQEYDRAISDFSEAPLLCWLR